MAQHVGRPRPQLAPSGYLAEPRARMGRDFEVDIGAFEHKNPPPDIRYANSGMAAISQAIAEPTVSADIDIGDQHKCGVLISCMVRENTLDAAVEFVSPGNKGRFEHRKAFVAKCIALLQRNVSVAIVDIVTHRSGNLYAELLGELGVSDPTLGVDVPSLYEASCRTQTNEPRTRFDAWAYPVVIGQPRPEMPLWDAPDQALTSDLEGSYEDTCQLLGLD
ncbi:hypothetical protein ACYOEI_07130 [Singulisphaera rosea]